MPGQVDLDYENLEDYASKQIEQILLHDKSFPDGYEAILDPKNNFIPLE